MDPSCASGMVNCREYWMNACTSPSCIAPDATCSPPTTAIPTYTRFPMKFMAGMISPEMNCAPKLAWYSSAFFARNRSSTSRCRPNTFTSACPVYVSSICPFSSPVFFHCATNSFCDRLAISAVIPSVNGMVTSAISASVGDRISIITSTPTTVSTDVTACEMVCCRLCDTLSTSLVTRLSSSPRWIESKYRSGSRWIFPSIRSRSR